MSPIKSFIYVVFASVLSVDSVGAKQIKLDAMKGSDGMAFDHAD